MSEQEKLDAAMTALVETKVAAMRAELAFLAQSMRTAVALEYGGGVAASAERALQKGGDAIVSAIATATAPTPVKTKGKSKSTSEKVPPAGWTCPGNVDTGAECPHGEDAPHAKKQCRRVAGGPADYIFMCVSCNKEVTSARLKATIAAKKREKAAAEEGEKKKPIKKAKVAPAPEPKLELELNEPSGDQEVDCDDDDDDDEDVE